MTHFDNDTAVNDRPANERSIKDVFINGRTHRAFKDQPIAEDTLKHLYDLTKLGPSASNLCPMRISFVQTPEGKDKVMAAAAAGNRPKIAQAPVVAIIAHDTAFHRHVETLAPHMDAEAYRQQDPAKLEQAAIENTWLQAGYFIIAARALGLDCGPMSGFDKAKIDAAFYQESTWRSEMLINLGYGDDSQLYPRGERLGFDQACTML